MRLLEAYVDNFGVLHTHHISFEHGMNVICAPNGSGKTTFAAFLQAMFYGLPASVRREPGRNPRKKYQPWQGGVFGGWVVVETAQRTLRIARTFGARPKDDTLQLTDAKTGRNVEISCTSIGEMLFGLDEESYARTVFLPQQSPGGSGDTLQGQLLSMLENNKDPADYIAAVQRLETARKTLQPMRGTGGVIGQLEQELAEIGKQWADASAEAQAQEKYSGTLSDLQHKLAEARADRAECVSALADAHRTAGSREELCRQLAEAEACFPEGAPLESELIAAENALHNVEMRKATSAGGGPGEEALELARSYAAQANEAQNILNTLVLPPEVCQRGKEVEKYFGGELPSQSAAEQWSKQIHLLTKFKIRRRWCRVCYLLLLIVTVFVCGIGAELLLKKNPWAWAAFSGGVLLFSLVCSVVAASLHFGKKIRFLRRLLKPIQQKYAPKLKLEHAVREAVKLRTEWEDIKKQVGELKSQRSRHVIARNEALRRLDDFFNRYGRPEGTTEQALAALQVQSSGPYVPDGSENSAFLISFLGRYAPDANISDPRRALQQIRSAWDRVQHLRTKTAHDPNDGVAEDQYRVRLQEADACIERLKNDVREATQRLETARNARVTAAELNERHNAVREQLTAAVRKRELLDRTLHWMQEAQDQLSVQYLIPMRARFLDYFRQMFDASANHLSIDPDLNIVWTQAGGERPISCFSDGTRSSAEVCVRLAMIDLLFRKERPVLILDDPFVYLDDDRLTRAMQVLSALGKDTQILYFTCHPSRQSGLDENV